MSVTEMKEASVHAARSATPVLRAVGVVKRFGDNVVLRGLDLDVASHEVVVLLGASGSGKSTLLRCANLLERVDDGQIFLGGEDITDPRANADKIRARIGVVFQHYNLFPHMSVLDNVTLAARKVHGWEKGRAHERGLELLDRIGLKDKVKEYPDRLSGGQQQRVAIARALATNPELLLLDEITAALDPVLVGEVLDLVREIKAQGSTILMATHEISFARQAADRVVFLRNGQIVEQGPPEQVIDDPREQATRDFLARILRSLMNDTEGGDQFTAGHPLSCTRALNRKVATASSQHARVSSVRIYSVQMRGDSR